MCRIEAGSTSDKPCGAIVLPARWFVRGLRGLCLLDLPQLVLQLGSSGGAVEVGSNGFDAVVY